MGLRKEGERSGHTMVGMIFRNELSKLTRSWRRVRECVSL